MIFLIKVYAKPWTRFAPYGIGLILGNILFHMKGTEDIIIINLNQDS